MSDSSEARGAFALRLRVSGLGYCRVYIHAYIRTYLHTDILGVLLGYMCSEPQFM